MFRRSAWLLVGALILTNCVKRNGDAQLTTTSVMHTSVKDQSIGNCWAYAVSAWIESLHLKATGEAVNISESYMTYWAFAQFLEEKKNATTVDISGSMGLARSIISEKGIVLEEEFLPEEAELTASVVQEKALAYITKQMAPGGRLHGAANRSAANIRKELDAAFGVKMAIAEKSALSAEKFVVAGKDGRKVTLAQSFNRFSGDAWQTVYLPQPAGLMNQYRDKISLRLRKALNDGMPVVMTIMIDWNGYDRSQSLFSGKKLKSAGKPGKQGAHMVVLDDYVVENVPGVGTIGEGEVDDRLKELALKGNIKFLKAKNSWGINAESKVPDGFTRFDWDYLTTNHSWTLSGMTLPYASMVALMLPPGY